MFCRIREGNENDILGFDITVEDFSYLIDNTYELLMTKMIKNAQLLKLINFPNDIIDSVVDVIVYNKDIEYLNDKLIKNNVPLYSLMINFVNSYKTKYKRLLKLSEMDEIMIECNKDNFIKGLELARKLNKNILIDGRSITLSDYHEILSHCDIEMFDGFDIKISYQEQNSEISIRELYETSNVINDMSKEIEKYNLSSLEKIIYVYDIVKKRIYKKSDDPFVSRDLDKVVKGDFIVCVGFSNLFNAVLRSLGINAMPLVSAKKCHQCSLVYVNDEKYNIDGVYVFDPTFDSRHTNQYIDNYNYFGLVMSDIKKSHENDIYDLTTLSFDDIVKLYDGDSIENTNNINKIEILFDFINEKETRRFFDTILYYKFVNHEEKTVALEIYNNFISKYNPEEIAADVFMMALCNARMIEYYNGFIDDFDIDDIRETVIYSSVCKKLKFSHNEDTLDALFEAFNCELNLDDVLDDVLFEKKEDIEKKILNVRLLKVLRKIRK